MSKDLEQVYDFVCRQNDAIIALCESFEDSKPDCAYYNLQGQLQMAWNIKTFIEENFIGNSKI